tara:strand:- start:640 stop:2412 length:1773 start_codon:yes stop_codon:yes gene_type:complete
MSWTLEYHGDERSLEAWGLGQLKRTRLNQGRDIVSFCEVSGRADIAERFAPESTITIRYGGVVWFQGVVVKAPGYGTFRGEGHHYELAGPWWYLENLIFQQSWAEALDVKSAESALTSVYKGRVILGQGPDGMPLSLHGQIEEIVRYAAEQGVPISLGTIDTDLVFPMDETKDLSCAEALTRVLRWEPGAVVWFDYTVGPHPAMHVSTRATMPDRTLAMEDLTRIDITPREDLRVPAVVLKYEKLHAADGVSWTTTEVDAHPETATGRELKALVLTIELDGLRGQCLQQPIRVEKIDEMNPAWWRDHLPGLANVKLEDIEITSAVRTSKLRSELVSGTIASWMPCEVEEDVVRARISYETPHETVIDRDVAVRIHATDAETQVYEHMVSLEEAEVTPVGLAKSLYEATSVLAYDGFIELETCEVDLNPYLGAVLNICGGRPEWAGMRAVIQELREDVDRGKMRVRFGPAKHLGPDDLVELLRVNRRRRATRRAGVRTRGRASGAAALEQGTHGRLDNAHAGPGQRSRVILSDPEHPDRTIELDVGVISKDITVALRHEPVSDNGILKSRLILASDPFLPSFSHEYKGAKR